MVQLTPSLSTIFIIITIIIIHGSASTGLFLECSYVTNVCQEPIKSAHGENATNDEIKILNFLKENAKYKTLFCESRTFTRHLLKLLKRFDWLRKTDVIGAIDQARVARSHGKKALTRQLARNKVGINGEKLEPANDEKRCCGKKMESLKKRKIEIYDKNVEKDLKKEDEFWAKRHKISEFIFLNSSQTFYANTTRHTGKFASSEEFPALLHCTTQGILLPWIQHVNLNDTHFFVGDEKTFSKCQSCFLCAITKPEMAAFYSNGNNFTVVFGFLASLLPVALDLPINVCAQRKADSIFSKDPLLPRWALCIFREYPINSILQQYKFDKNFSQMNNVLKKYEKRYKNCLFLRFIYNRVRKIMRDEESVSTKTFLLKKRKIIMNMKRLLISCLLRSSNEAEKLHNYILLNNHSRIDIIIIGKLFNSKSLPNCYYCNKAKLKGFESLPINIKYRKSNVKKRKTRGNLQQQHSTYYNFNFNITTLQVTEGERSFIDTNHIKIPRTIYYDVTLKDCLFFTISEAPIHGDVLFLTFHETTSQSNPTNIDSKENRVEKFFIKELINRKIYYKHDGSESMRDSIQIMLDLDLSMVKETIYNDSRKPESVLREEYDEEIHRLEQIWSFKHRPLIITLEVQIKPINDPPRIVVANGGMIQMVADTEVLISTEMLSAVDPDDNPDQLQWVVQYGGSSNNADKSGNDWALTDVGYFEVEDDFGNVRSRVAKFTGRHLNQDKVSFAHRGVTTQTVALQVSDGKATSQTQTLTFIGSPLTIKMVNNTGVVVDHAQTHVLITSKNLTFTSNHMTLHDNVIRFHMVDPPYEGFIQRKKKDYTTVEDEDDDEDDDYDDDDDDDDDLGLWDNGLESKNLHINDGYGKEKNKRNKKNKKNKNKHKKNKKAEKKKKVNKKNERKKQKQLKRKEKTLAKNANIRKEGEEEKEEWEIVRFFTQQQINENRIRYYHFPDEEDEDKDGRDDDDIKYNKDPSAKDGSKKSKTKDADLINKNNNSNFDFDKNNIIKDNNNDIKVNYVQQLRVDVFKFKVSVLNRETAEYEFKIFIKSYKKIERNDVTKIPNEHLLSSASVTPHTITVSDNRILIIDEVMVDEYDGEVISEENIKVNTELIRNGGGESSLRSFILSVGGDVGVVVLLTKLPEYGRLYFMEKNNSVKKTIETDEVFYFNKKNSYREFDHAMKSTEQSNINLTYNTLNENGKSGFSETIEDEGAADEESYGIIDLNRFNLYYQHITEGSSRDQIKFKVLVKRKLIADDMEDAKQVFLLHGPGSRGYEMPIYILPKITPLTLLPLTVNRGSQVYLKEDNINVGKYHSFEMGVDILILKQPQYGCIQKASLKQDKPVFTSVNQFEFDDVKSGQIRYNHDGKGNSDWFLLAALIRKRNKRSMPQIFNIEIKPQTTESFVGDIHNYTEFTVVVQKAAQKPVLVKAEVGRVELYVVVVQGGWKLLQGWELWGNKDEDVSIVVDKRVSVGKLIKLGDWHDSCVTMKDFNDLTAMINKGNGECWQGVKRHLYKYPPIKQLHSKNLHPNTLLFLHDGHNANPGSIHFKGFRTKNSKTTSFIGVIKIEVIPSVLNASTNAHLNFLQGDFSTLLSRNLFNISTNSPDPYYDVQFKLNHFRSDAMLICEKQLECKSFNLFQFLSDSIAFIQSKASLPPNISLDITDGSKVISNVIIPINVTPRLPKPNNRIKITADTNWFRLTLSHLNSTDLSELSQDDPLYKVVGGLDAGTLVLDHKMQFQKNEKFRRKQKNGDSNQNNKKTKRNEVHGFHPERVTAFRHSHVKSGMLLYYLKQPLATGSVVEEILKFELRAKNCQTAEGTLTFEIQKREGLLSEEKASITNENEHIKNESKEDGYELDSTQRQYLLIAVILGILTVLLLLVCCCIAACCCFKRRKNKIVLQKPEVPFMLKNDDVTLDHDEANDYARSLVRGQYNSGSFKRTSDGSSFQMDKSDYLVPNNAKPVRYPTNLSHLPQPPPPPFQQPSFNTSDHYYDEPPDPLAVSMDELSSQQLKQHFLQQQMTCQQPILNPQQSFMLQHQSFPQKEQNHLLLTTSVGVHPLQKQPSFVSSNSFNTQKGKVINTDIDANNNKQKIKVTTTNESNSNNSNTNTNIESCRESSIMSETSEGTTEDTYNWKNLDPELLEHCRITNPVLKKTQYWV